MGLISKKNVKRKKKEAMKNKVDILIENYASIRLIPSRKSELSNQLAGLFF